MEINLTEDRASFEVSQKGFIEELLRAHGHKGSKSWSMGFREQLLLTPKEEEELLEETPPRQGEVDLAELRQAQRRVVELLWLMSRSRPDLQYVVALTVSRVSKSPKVVNKIGHKLLHLCLFQLPTTVSFLWVVKSQMTRSTCSQTRRLRLQVPGVTAQLQ